METAGKAKTPDTKCYGKGKIAQRLTKAQRNAFKGMEYSGFTATEALRKVYKNKISYKTSVLPTEKMGHQRFRRVKHNLERFLEKMGDCRTGASPSTPSHSEEQNDVSSDVESDV